MFRCFAPPRDSQSCAPIAYLLRKLSHKIHTTLPAAEHGVMSLKVQTRIGKVDDAEAVSDFVLKLAKYHVALTLDQNGVDSLLTSMNVKQPMTVFAAITTLSSPMRRTGLWE